MTLFMDYSSHDADEHSEVLFFYLYFNEVDQRLP